MQPEKNFAGAKDTFVFIAMGTAKILCEGRMWRQDFFALFPSVTLQSASPEEFSTWPPRELSKIHAIYSA